MRLFLCVSQLRLSRAASFASLTALWAAPSPCPPPGLHVTVTRHFAGCVLEGTLDLVGGTSDVFAIHDRLPSKADVSSAKPLCRFTTQCRPNGRVRHR